VGLFSEKVVVIAYAEAINGRKFLPTIYQACIQRTKWGLPKPERHNGYNQRV